MTQPVWSALVGPALALLFVLGACGQTSPTAPGQATPAVSPAGAEPQARPTVAFATSEVAPAGQIAPDASAAPRSSDCPRLESQLAQIVSAPDPLKLAAQLGLTIKDGKLQVQLVMASEDTSFLQSFDAEVGSQAGTKVQAFVPIDRLCDLAKADAVLAVRLPAQAIPQS